VSGCACLCALRCACAVCNSAHMLCAQACTSCVLRNARPVWLGVQVLCAFVCGSCAHLRTCCACSGSDAHPKCLGLPHYHIKMRLPSLLGDSWAAPSADPAYMSCSCHRACMTPRPVNDWLRDVTLSVLCVRVQRQDRGAWPHRGCAVHDQHRPA